MNRSNGYYFSKNLRKLTRHFRGGCDIEGWAFAHSALTGTEADPFVIPENVYLIEDYAFYNCSNHNAVKMLSETPADIDYDTFPSGIVIYVPASAKDAYEEAWSGLIGYSALLLKTF